MNKFYVDKRKIHVVCNGKTNRPSKKDLLDVADRNFQFS